MGRRTRRKATKAVRKATPAAKGRATFLPPKTAAALANRPPIGIGFAPVVKLACADDDGAPSFSAEGVQLVPAGRVSLADGDTLIMDAAAAEQAIAAFHSQGVDVPIDIDHATVHRAPKGLSAPAQGWIKSLSWDPAVGLVGNVDWTAAGARLVHHESYRYLSPVVFFDSTTKRIRRLHSAALTNKPAIRNMGALKAASEAAILEEFATMDGMGAGLMQSPDQLAGEIKQLLIGLGVEVPDDADLTATMIAAKAYLQNAGSATDGDDEGDDDESPEAAAVAHIASDVLKLTGDVKPADVVAGVERLAMTAKAAGGSADLAALHEEMAGLRDFRAKTEAKERVSNAVTAGKLNPNASESMAWAHDFAARNPGEFDKWAKAAPTVAPPSGSVVKGTAPDLAPSDPLSIDGDGGAKILSEAVEEHKGDKMAALHAVQVKILGEYRDAGLTNEAARAKASAKYPKIFG